jgi:hypothetical protein
LARDSLEDAKGTNLALGTSSFLKTNAALVKTREILDKFYDNFSLKISLAILPVHCHQGTALLDAERRPANGVINQRTKTRWPNYPIIIRMAQIGSDTSNYIN